MRNSFQPQEKEESSFPITRLIIVGIVIGLVVLALIPYGWFPFWKIFKYAPALGWRIELLFDSDAAHILGHLTIFIMIGTGVLLWFPSLIYRPRIYLGIMVTIGFLQEVFQLIGFKHRAPVWDDLFDIVVDVSGTLIALTLMRFVWKKHGNAPDSIESKE